MPQKVCTEFGNTLASLAAGKYAGVAKNANIYRYVSTQHTHNNIIYNICTYI